MIISHKHRFIFIHCRKAAGTSVTVSLARYLGSWDVQIGSVEDTLHNAVALNVGALSRLLTPAGSTTFLRRFAKNRKLRAALNNAVKASYRKSLGPIPAHPEAFRIRDAFPQPWQTYTKFCIVRNPYERIVSDYFWRTNNVESPPTFDEFVAAIYRGDTLAGIVPANYDNWPMYTIDDRIAVDHVIRYENLVPELTAVCRDIGLPWDGWLPRAKRGKKKPSYRSVYTDREIELVSRIYAKEIAHFHYAFPDERST